MKRLILVSACAALALIGTAARVETQGARAGAPQGRPGWAWKPAIPTVKSGEIDVLHVKGNVYMLVGAATAFADTVTLRTRIEATGPAITLGDVFDGAPAAVASRAISPSPPAGQVSTLSVPLLSAVASAAGLEWTPPAGVTDVEAGAVLVFDLPLPAPGQYAFEISLDGAEGYRVPLSASQLPGPPADTPTLH